MLASVLALVIGLGSLALYAIAFLLPALHRKSDFIWSGVGLFYALVLWVCAGQIRGGILLGQTASVVLLGWFGWQMLKLRWELLPVGDRPDLPGLSSATELVSGTVNRVRGQSSVKRSPTPFNGGSRSTTSAPVRPQPSATDSFKAVPEYELVEPESVVPRPNPFEGLAAKPVTPPIEPTPVPVPSMQPATLKSRSQPTPNSSPLETAQAIFTSLKEGGQQLWRSISGRKPKRTMIVLDRTKPSATPAQVQVEPPATSDEDDFDFDLETEEAILNNEVELDPAAVDGVVEPETFTETGEVAIALEVTTLEESVELVEPDTTDDSGEQPEVPELVRPDPPDPQLVAEALADAEAKDLPADPPEPAAPDATASGEIPPG